MQIRVFYFAVVRDLVGHAEELITVTEEAPQVATLIALLTERYARLSMEGVRVAVNEEFVELTHPLIDGDTLALIPPVSGG